MISALNRSSACLLVLFFAKTSAFRTIRSQILKLCWNIYQSPLCLKRFLNELGYNVLRFWNNEVLFQFDAVMDQIYQHVVFDKPSSALSGTFSQREKENHPE